MKEMCSDVPDLNRNQLPARFKLCVYGIFCDLCEPVDVKKKKKKVVDKFVIAVHCSLSD
jgi:predicted nucleic acid binding AN1-type Zn finger protein